VKIWLQADADLRSSIVKGVRRREAAIDFQTAEEANLTGLDDPTVLAVAAAKGRVLVSHDFRTMPEHFGRFITSETSAGVILISQDMSISQAIEGLILIWWATEAEEWINRISRLPL